jgi:uracil-DNA glycosylase
LSVTRGAPRPVETCARPAISLTTTTILAAFVMPTSITKLLAEVRACQVCAAHLPHRPRPIVQLGASARLVIIGQAPGSKVHESGVPWQDDSGDRLRDWTGLNTETFYDPARVALLPMGFCYPGPGDNADLPPRPECAPLWHARLLATLPSSRLVLLVGIHAQGYYLKGQSKRTMTETVRGFADHLPTFFPLPHPSWRSTGWMRKNPWFDAKVLPRLRLAVSTAVA